MIMFLPEELEKYDLMYKEMYHEAAHQVKEKMIFVQTNLKKGFS